MPDEDKHFGGFLALDFRKWWRPVKTIYCSSNIDDVCSLLLLYVLYHNTFIFGRLKVFSSLLEMDGGYALLASRTYFGESAIETSKTNTAGKSRYQLQFENYHEFFFSVSRYLHRWQETHLSWREFWLVFRSLPSFHLIFSLTAITIVHLINCSETSPLSLQCVSFDIWLKVYFQGYSLTIEKNGNIAQETENVSHKHQVLVVI